MRKYEFDRLFFVSRQILFKEGQFFGRDLIALAVIQHSEVCLLVVETIMQRVFGVLDISLRRGRRPYVVIAGSKENFVASVRR
jgi:hypothetical protein